MRATTAFNTLLDLEGVTVTGVRQHDDELKVAVRLRRRRLACPVAGCGHSTLTDLHHRGRDRPRRPVPNRIIDIEQQLYSIHLADAPLQRRVRASTPRILAGRGTFLRSPAAPNRSGCTISV